MLRWVCRRIVDLGRSVFSDLDVVRDDLVMMHRLRLLWRKANHRRSMLLQAVLFQPRRVSNAIEVSSWMIYDSRVCIWKKTLKIASTFLLSFLTLARHDDDLMDGNDAMKEADLAQWRRKCDDVISQREAGKMKVCWWKMSTWGKKDKGTNWSEHTTWKKIGKVIDRTGGAMQRRDEWWYDVKLNYDSPRRRWRYEWGEAEVKLNDRRLIKV